MGFRLQSRIICRVSRLLLLEVGIRIWENQRWTIVTYARKTNEIELNGMKIGKKFEDNNNTVKCSCGACLFF